MYEARGKRIFDVMVASAALLVFSPVMLVAAVLIRLQDGGPAIFRQQRAGRCGQPFTLLKFRSMPVDTEHRPSDQAGTLPVTRIGRFIRRTNIDELPQLINVLRGDMSIVGPRPALPSQTRLIELRRHNGAYRCLPGLTGLAQVEGYDGMSVEAKAEFDAEYSRRTTLMMDLTIIGRTTSYLLRPPPVY